jgi:pimeloyl-ACP methyl ester carboxylesterase
MTQHHRTGGVLGADVSTEDQELHPLEYLVRDRRGILHDVRLVLPDSDKGPARLVLMIGGIPKGSENDKQFSPLSDMFGKYAKGLIDQGFMVAAMNTAGMGLSMGNTKTETLATRLAAWEIAAKRLLRFTGADPQHLRIIGNSMGGHIAIRLQARLARRGIRVDRMALISPAIYADYAENYRFGHLPTPSTERLLESRALKQLRAYPGQLLVSYVRNDSVIRPEAKAEIFEGPGCILQQAIDQGRGLGYSLRLVQHNYRPLAAGWPGPEFLAAITRAEAVQQIVGFLTK